MKNIIQISLVLSCLLLLSCKKDKIVAPLVSTNPIQDNCPEMYETRTSLYPLGIVKTDYPYCPSGIEQYLDKGDYVYVSCVLNPSNPYEFAFLRRKYSTGNTSNTNYELGVYNFCTNETKIIRTNLLNTSIDFNPQGWVLFCDQVGFKKIKSDGSEFVVLNTPQLIGLNDFVKTSPDGSNYLGCDLSLSKLYIFSEGNTNYQECPVSVQNAVWYSNHEIIVYQTGIGFSLYNINTNELHPWSNFSPSNRGWDYHVKNGKLYYPTDSGLFEIDSNSSQLIDTYHETFYATSIQPLNDDYLLIQRNVFDSTDYMPCKYHFQRFISVFNRNTQTEKMIQIP
jgi:hypothetical protein